MKRKMVSLFLTVAMAISLTACGGNEEPTEVINDAAAESEDTEDATENEVVEEVSSETDGELSSEEKSKILEEYREGLTQLDGATFDMNAKYSDESGIEATITGESGLLYWQYSLKCDNLITTEYDSKGNTLTYKSLDVDDSGQIEVTSEITLEDAIPLSDDLKILFSGVSIDMDKRSNVIMIESRSDAYTYADGVSYRIVLINIDDDGNLEKIYDDSLAGSGDDDITATLRAGFNSVMGHEYSQNDFEDMFYNGNLFIEAERKPIHARIEFQSEGAKLADAGDWDGANQIASKLYGFDGDPEEVYWGQGSISRD